MEKIISKEKTNCHKIQPIGILFLGFLALIILGSILLVMPFATKSGTSIKYIDALFVATSATCVTGLTPFSTIDTFNLFGQIVILCLIQIGGLGFMTFISLIMLLFRKDLGLFGKTILIQSAGSFSFASIKPLLKKILIFTLIIELSGWGLITLFLYDELGNSAIYIGLFTSISAFCNAGFDLFGNSLASYSSNIGIMLTVMFLINIGGIGFIVLSDLFESKFKFTKLQMHSKIVLVANAILVFVPFLLFFLFEFVNFGQNGMYIDLPFKDKILNSLFLSITPRTAGFYTLPYETLTSASKELTMMLMFIGGNSGSTAGGLKVTTLVVIILTLIATAKRESQTTAFKRKIGYPIVSQSSALFFSYIIILAISITAISSYESSVTLEGAMFECISALCTVGLSLGLTPSLSVFSKVLLVILMYLGRIGAFGLFALIMGKGKQKLVSSPEGRILVG